MNEIVESICQLLSSMEGVELTGETFETDVFRIEFTVSDACSRLIVHDLAEVSNVPLNIYAQHASYSEEGRSDPDRALLYRFYGSGNKETEDEACWLGAHLTWMLYKVGRIDAALEKKYSAIFGAVSKSN